MVILNKLVVVGMHFTKLSKLPYLDNPHPTQVCLK